MTGLIVSLSGQPTAHYLGEAFLTVADIVAAVGGTASGSLSIPRFLVSWLADEKTTLQFMTGGTLVMPGVWIGAPWVPKKKEEQ